MFRVVFNTVFIWKIDTELWIWKVGGRGGPDNRAEYLRAGVPRDTPTLWQPAC